MVPEKASDSLGPTPPTCGATDDSVGRRYTWNIPRRRVRGLGEPAELPTAATMGGHGRRTSIDVLAQSITRTGHIPGATSRHAWEILLRLWWTLRRNLRNRTPYRLGAWLKTYLTGSLSSGSSNSRD